MIKRPILLALLLLIGWNLFAAPANDDPCNAIQLDAMTSCITTTYTNAAATNSSGVINPGCGAYSGGDVWFSFTLPNNGYHVVLDATMGTMVDGAMAVYSGACGSLNLVSCDDMGDGTLSIRVEDGCTFENAGETFWLRVWDNGNSNNGTFDLCAYSTYPEVPVGAAACSTFAPPGNTCCDATILSDGLDGYCGSTIGYNDVPGSIAEFCAFLDNNSWVGFVAGSEEVTLEVASANCIFGNGIQVAILETSDCTNFSIKSNCWNPGVDSFGLVTATNLTPGEIYYLMVDGWGGDLCDYTIRVISGIQTTEVTVSDDTICAGQSTQLMANVIGAGPFSYNWSPAGSLDDPTIQNPIASPTVPTTYSVTITGADDPIHTVDVHVDIAVPGQATIDGTTTVCEGSTGVTYSIDSPIGGVVYSWTVTGGATISGSNIGTSIEVDWSSTGGDICVVATNACGPGMPSCITISTIPKPDISMNNPGAVCAPATINLSTIPISNGAFVGGPVTYYATEAHALAGTPTLSSPIVSTGGTYWVRMDSGPDCFDHTSVVVTIEDPQIFINPPAVRCAPNTVDLSSLLINEMNGTGSPSGLFYYTDSMNAVNKINPLASPVVSTGGVYWVRYERPTGCFDVAPVNVQIFLAADISLDHVPTICLGESIDLDTISFTDANNTVIASKTFHTSFALALSGFLPMSNTVVQTSAFMRIVTNNGCPTIVPINIVTLPLPEVSFSAPSSVCTGEDIDLTFTLVGTPPFEIVYNNGTADITINNIILNTHEETVSINANTTFTLVSVSDAGPCTGVLNTAPISVTANPLPTATISGNADICSGSSTLLTFNFTGNGPFNIVHSGGSLNGLTNGSTFSVSPGSTTTYTLVSVEDALGCEGTVSGSAAINVNSPLTTQNISETCNSSFSGYTVSFEISGGTPASYVVNGGTGTLTGNQFVSDEITAGTNYSFTISDASGCPSIVVSGSQDCNCIDDAGTMDNTLVEVCQNETLTVPVATGVVLETGHLVQYVLHDNIGAILGTVFAQSNTPSFTFQTGMTANTTYYVSSIVGPDNGSGGVDVLHTCFDIAEGTPVRFLEAADATISGTTDICTDDLATLTISITGGVGPFNIVYSDGIQNLNLTNVNDGDTFDVGPASTTTYTIVSIVDQTSAACAGTVNGTAVITVNDGPQASPVAYECDAINTQFRVSFVLSGGDPSSYIVNGTPGNLDAVTNVFTSDWLVNGTNYSFEILDANNCDPRMVTGTYECPCTSYAGTMSAALKEACEGETVSFDHAADHVLDGDDVLGFILHDGGATTPGAIMLRNSIPEFAYDASLVLGTTYYVSAIVSNDDGLGFPVTDISLDRCLSISEGQPVRFDPITEAWITGATTLCEGDSTPIVFNFADPGEYDVIWSDGTNNFTATGMSNGDVIMVSPTVNTTYSLVGSESSTSSRCASTIDPTTSQITIPVIDVPEINDFAIVCDNLGAFFVVSFTISGGDPANYVVNGNPGTLTGNSFVSEPMISGLPYLFEISDGSGCPPVTLTATEYCSCTPDIRAEISIEENISCPGEADGSLSVNNVNGLAPFVFNWDTGNTGTDISGLPTGTYTVTMTDANACTRIDSFFLSQPDSISADIEGITTTCHGDADGMIELSSVRGGTGEYSFGIENLVTEYPDEIFYNLEGGEYTVIITDANGCTGTQMVEVPEPEKLIVDLGDDVTLDLGDSIDLIAFANLPIDSILWTPEELMDCTNCMVQNVKPFLSTRYSIAVSNDAGCKSEDDIRIFIDNNPQVYIPNAFSPNGDGNNDFFTVYGGSSVTKIHTIQVFSRWGEVLYSNDELELNNEEEGWNGKFKGRQMPSGVYTYFTEIEFVDGSRELFKGSVNLLRW